MEKRDFRNKIILFLTLIIFIIAELLICPHHEHFCDEAQPWLMARDASFLKLITYYTHYEFCPALWHFILKIFILFKLPYNLFYIVPIIFSSIGVGLFLFKSKFPIWVKISIPFTYYIFYQYTVVARNYCLILPFLAGLAIVYPKKIQKPFLFALFLILFSGISIHSLLASVSIFSLYLFNLIKYSKSKDFSPELFKRNIFSSIIILASLILTFSLIWPPKDYMFRVLFQTGIINLEMAINSLGNLLVFKTDFLILDLIGIILLIFFVFSFYKKSFRIIELILITAPVFLFMSFVYYADHHLALLFLLIIFSFWIHFDDSKYEFKKNKMFYILLAVIILVQINWTFRSVSFDLNNDYSGANKATQFINQNLANKKKIYGCGYEIVALQPFFAENIFTDRKTSFYIWRKKFDKFNSENIFNDKPDIVVLPFSAIKNHSLNINLNLYTVNVFKGSIFVKNRVFKDDSFYVFIKK